MYLTSNLSYIRGEGDIIIFVLLLVAIVIIIFVLLLVDIVIIIFVLLIVAIVIIVCVLCVQLLPGGSSRGVDMPGEDGLPPAAILLIHTRLIDHERCPPEQYDRGISYLLQSLGSGGGGGSGSGGGGGGGRGMRHVSGGCFNHERGVCCT